MQTKLKGLVIYVLIIISGIIVFQLVSNGAHDIIAKEIYTFINNQDTNIFKKIINRRLKIIDSTYDNSANSVFSTYTSSKRILSTRLSFLNILENNSDGRIPGNSIQLKDKSNDKGKENNKDNVNKNPKNNKETATPKKANTVTINAANLAITNLSDKKISANKYISSKLSFNSSKKNGNIIIYHTHTSEGYIDNPKGGVVDAAKVMNKELEKTYGFNVIHNVTVNDSNYNLAYTKGLNTVTQLVRGNKKNNIIFDVHRDANSEKTALKVIKEYKGTKYAQIMFVVGTNINESNPNWEENLKLAIHLQNQLNKIVPGICRPIYVTNKRYNQHIGEKNIIIELGGDGNTQKEANASAKVLAAAINNLF